MPMTTLQEFSALIEDDVFDVLTLEGSVSARDHFGGTAPKQVQQAVAVANKLLKLR
jgi:argininosuccinate lyase